MINLRRRQLIHHKMHQHIRIKCNWPLACLDLLIQFSTSSPELQCNNALHIWPDIFNLLLNLLVLRLFILRPSIRLHWTSRLCFKLQILLLDLNTAFIIILLTAKLQIKGNNWKFWWFLTDTLMMTPPFAQAQCGSMHSYPGNYNWQYGIADKHQ